MVNTVTAVALVLTIQRLLRFATAIARAALLSVFVSVGAPFVATNEWNPIITMLPLVLFMAVPLTLRESTGLPIVAFLASAIVQTHVG